LFFLNIFIYVLIFKLSLFYQEDGILLHVSCVLYYHILILAQHKKILKMGIVYKRVAKNVQDLKYWYVRFYLMRP